MWTDNYNVGYAIRHVEERHLEKPDRNRLNDALPKSVLEKIAASIWRLSEIMHASRLANVVS